jgi:photosystem II stability/assembly factor-like uncharacterized protein
MRTPLGGLRAWPTRERSDVTRSRLVQRFAGALLLLLLRPAAARAGSSWVPIGPDGGEVDVVAAAPSDPGVVYAASNLGGVFLSEDAGATWRPVNGGLSDLRVQCLAVSPADPNTAYAGTQTGGFKTTDAGTTWTPLGGGFPAARASSIAIDPVNPNVLYAAGTSGTLVKSADGGATWSAIGGTTFAASEPRVLAIDPVHTANLYLGTQQSGMYRSTNAGVTWTQSNSGLTDVLGNAVTAINALAVDPTTPARVFAGTFNAGVFLSSDAGADWVAANDGIAIIALVTGIAVGSDGTVYLGQQGGLYIQPPGVPVWLTDFPGASYVNSLSIGVGAVPPLYIGYGKAPFEAGGFIRWDGGSSFPQAHLPLLVIAAIAADPGQPGRALVATTAGVFEYLPGASSGPWNPPFAGGGSSNSTVLPAIAVFFDPRTAGTVYFGAAANVYKSTDGGFTTTASPVGDPSAFPLAIVRCFVAQSGTAQGVLAGTSTGLFQTADGSTWTAGSPDLASRQIFALASDPTSASTLWAGTDDGVYGSSDAGAHWSKAGTGVGGTVHAVLVAAGGAGRLLAGADAGLFSSLDGGATWAPAAGVAATVNALVQDPTTGALFAGSLVGVFESSDGGASWSAASEGLSNPNVFCLGLLGDGTFLAGTNGGSVFEQIRTADRGSVSRASEGPSTRALPPRP